MPLGPISFTNVAIGLVDWTYPGPAIEFQSPTTGGAVDGAIYLYRAQTFSGSQWEIGIGAYTASTGVFARTTVLFNSLGTTAKINFGTPPQILVQAYSGREALTGSRNYYVRTDGSDSNNGLANSAGGAFLTIQKAIDVACALDMSIFPVVINVAAGTYTAAIVLKNYVGVGPITITGDTATPSNCFIDVTGASAISGSPGRAYTMQGFKTRTTTSGFHVNLSGRSDLTLGQWEFGASAASHLLISGGARAFLSANYTISGGAFAHIFCTEQSEVAYTNAITVTLTGTPAFSGFFVNCTRQGGVVCQSTPTFSGAATGTRYQVDGLAYVYTGGGGPNFFPGSVAGAAPSNGGIYA